uniref:DM13 domain-containing protein n=1 Tax=Setaria digitata TaxID=48799 RepID=A0A915PJ25_9BILA
MILFPSLLCLFIPTLPGHLYGKSKSNLKPTSIVPWSEYLATTNDINNQAATFQEILAGRRPLLMPLKGVGEKNFPGSNIRNDKSVPPVLKRSYFRRRWTQYNSHSTMLPNTPDSRNIWITNRFQRRNHTELDTVTTASHHQAILANTNTRNIRIPTNLRVHPLTRVSSDPQMTRLYAANSFKQFISVANASVSSRFPRLDSADLSISYPGSPVLAQPRTNPAPFFSSIADVKNLHRLSDSVASLLFSRHTMESLAKFTQSLLRFSTPDQPGEILSSLSKSVSATSPRAAEINTITKISTGTPSSIKSIQQVFVELARKDFPIKSIWNDTLYENETEVFLKTFPEEQRSLLQGAIQTGELDIRTLRSIFGNANYKRKQNEGKLLEWIQQNRKKSAEEMFISTDKLPYYGKYCGSFAGQTSESSRFNAAGALWAVDDRRFILSKFQFNPGTMLTENITFWVGPNEQTNNSVTDMIPNANGFYLKPQPISFSVFYKPNITNMEAHIRSKLTSFNQRSNLYTELFVPNTDEILPEDAISSAVIFLESSKQLISGNAKDLNVRIALNKSSNVEPLGWYAGFQPLLLTLPDNKGIKTINWFALYDHKRQDIIAYVLIPNGPAFKIPAVVYLRGLTPNNVHNVRSKYIKVLDTKTIEVSKFYYRSNGLAAWFVVGKNILPNSDGHIVPVYDRASNRFDCDSLRDYTNETVILKLPGHLDIKDVFWFSVFSMEQGLSLSHLYFPYNDMYLPPDLTDISVSSIFGHFETSVFHETYFMVSDIKQWLKALA